MSQHFLRSWSLFAKFLDERKQMLVGISCKARVWEQCQQHVKSICWTGQAVSWTQHYAWAFKSLCICTLSAVYQITPTCFPYATKYHIWYKIRLEHVSYMNLIDWCNKLIVLYYPLNVMTYDIFQLDVDSRRRRCIPDVLNTVICWDLHGCLWIAWLHRIFKQCVQ